MGQQRFDIKAGHDQTVKCDMDEDDDDLHIEEEPEEEEKQYTNKRGNLNPPKALIINEQQRV